MRVRPLLITLAVTAAFVAGCTDPQPAEDALASLTADQIYDRAIAALAAAPTVHVAGDIDAANKVDVRYSAEKSAGTITVNNATAEVKIIGTDAYLKAGADFYTLLLGPAVGPAFAAKGAGKWYHGATNDARLAGALSLANPSALLSFDGAITKGTTKDVDGRPAIGLVDDGPDGGTLWIATTGDPLPLRIEAKSGATLTFTYNESFTVEPPPAADVIEVPAV